MCLVFERFGGLRISEETEIDGLDAHQWGGSNYADDDVASHVSTSRNPEETNRTLTAATGAPLYVRD